MPAMALPGDLVICGSLCMTSIFLIIPAYTYIYSSLCSKIISSEKCTLAMLEEEKEEEEEAGGGEREGEEERGREGGGEMILFINFYPLALFLFSIENRCLTIL